MLQDPTISILGPDPKRTHRINANSFQQNAITTVNGWQYIAFYTDSSKSGICYINLARRQIQTFGSSRGLCNKGELEILTFVDYEQTVDDGHNTISIGICRADGTIHLSFDHHCDQLRFKISKPGITHSPTSHTWEPSLFSEVQNCLPGIPANDLMKEVTYPRFVNIDDDLLLTYRIGQAGLGSDILYHYSSVTYLYTYIGEYLTGISNSPYINGIDYRLSRLHISWCYRNFVSLPPSSSPNAHKQQAGPNGPENNHDLNYAYSDDLGLSWKNSIGNTIAVGEGSKQSVDTTIKPGVEGARVFEIPMGSGILNQEAQTADWSGGFFVLNREKRSEQENWILYYRDPAGNWSKSVVPSFSKPTEIGSRASVCVDRSSNLYLVLPGNLDSSLTVVRAGKEDGYQMLEVVWKGDGFDGEPLIDVQRLEADNVLSVFTRTDTMEESRNVVVLDFLLDH